MSKMPETKHKIKIYACEENEFFYNISNKFISKYDKSNIIHLLNEHSNNLTKSKSFNNESINLIVTEIFDDGLLGENALDTFYNALVVNNLMDKSNLITIPKSAKIYLWYYKILCFFYLVRNPCSKYKRNDKESKKIPN